MSEEDHDDEEVSLEPKKPEPPKAVNQSEVVVASERQDNDKRNASQRAGGKGPTLVGTKR